MILAITGLTPCAVFATGGPLTLTSHAHILVSGIDVDVTGPSNVIQSITVSAGSFSLALTTGSSISISAPGLNVLGDAVSGDSANEISASVCTGSASTLSLSYSGGSTVTNVIAPSASICTDTSTPPGPTQTSTPTPTVTTSYSSSGGSVSSQVNNLIAMGNYTLAKQIAKQYGLTIPTQNIPVQNIPINTPASNLGQSFTRTLRLGVTSKDVKRLQVFLNAQGFTVAMKGAGSPGHETTYFGPATKAALMKFQLAHKKETLDPQGLKSPTGFFGVDTMKEVNRLMKR